ncbi:hypothetical protein ATANTOWER_007562 [Ataeniobius toweri]|uniref:Uncharacterized protein n=1 Tax=Ataeniobius toweri TaxID=208326 RepID=A0ABU7B5A8_9TELE|nr:hypothetical protein [Ataeniobius toweri]
MDFSCQGCPPPHHTDLNNEGNRENTFNLHDRTEERVKEQRKSAHKSGRKSKTENREIRNRRERKGKVNGRVQDRFLLEWPGLARVVESFLKGRSLFTADMTRLPCREGNASPQPCYY